MPFRILFFALLVSLLSCQKEVPPEPEPEPEPEVPAPDCSIRADGTNMIVDVSESSDTLVFTYENRRKLFRSQDCIRDYSIDSAGWTLHVEYADSTEETLPFFGTVQIHPDSMIQDPYGRAPLTATVSFRLPHPRRVRVTVHGNTSSARALTHLFPEPSLDHSIPVFGLYPDYLNRVTISIVDNFGTDRIRQDFMLLTGFEGRIQTGEMSVLVNDYADSIPDRFYLVQNAIYDSEGNVRWYTRYGGQKFFPLHGNLIAIQLYNDKGAPVPTEEDIRVIDLMGKEIALYDVPHRNHHEIVEKTPGGNLLVATNAEPYFTTDDDTEDAIVEIDRQSGEVVRFWDLREIFDPSRERLWTEMPNDWCHLNSIQYDPTDQTLLISSKLQYFISKIDYGSGAIRWIFGNHENWKEPWQSYLLEPLNFDTSEHPDQDWTYAQHMPRLTGRGTVIVYDNGRSRPGTDFTRVHEFRVDSAKNTVETVWTHDFGFSTRTMGSVRELENGSVHVGHGEIGRVMEVTRDGQVVFDGKVKTFYRSYPFEFYPEPD